MKTYKKIMNGVAMVEKLILVLATILIVVLTVGNVCLLYTSRCV